MKRKLTLFLALFFVGIGFIMAQTQVRGTVVDEKGEPIIGANIRLKSDPQRGAATDFDGKFTILAPANDKLVVSYVGYVTQEVSVSATVRVVMKPDTELLDEVLVVAYGTAKKSTFAGSATSVKGDKIQKLQTSNIAKSLEGIAAGVQTSSSTGQPGSGASILIRGLGSISASQSPLIVLDGVPYEGSLNSIPPQDIADLTILKDAAANSMYGARGANGVIMVTTQKGRMGKAKINVDMRFGYNDRGVPNYDIITDPGDYYRMYWRALYNAAGQNADFATSNLIGGGYGVKYNIFKGVKDNEVILSDGTLNPKAKDFKWKDSWLTDPFTKGIRQEYNVNVSGATDKTNYYISLGYLGDEGYIKNSGFKRVSSRLRLEQILTDYLKIGGNISYSKTMQNAPNTGNSNYSNLFMFTQRIAPIFPIYLYDLETGSPILDKNGNMQYDFGDRYHRPYAQDQNPVATNMANIREYHSDNITARGFAEFKFLNDFKFTTNLAYDVFNGNNTEFMTPIGGDAKAMNGRGEKWTTRKQAINFNQLLNYDKKLNDHTFNVLLGHEVNTVETRYLYGHMTNFLREENPEFNNAAHYNGLESYKSEYALEGYFSRLEYNYDNKYFFTGSVRRDGSSRFHEDNRWGTFWALGASWILTNEEFMKNLSGINTLKLKASYGTQGNDAIGATIAYYDLFNVSRPFGELALIKKRRGNPDLTWEKSANFNIGFESRLLNRIDFSTEFFIKETKDLIYNRPLALSKGSPTSITRNELDMKNTGVEFELGIDVVKTKDVLWNIAFNGTHYKNELTRLPSDKDQDGYAAGSYWRKKGGSLYDWYLKEYAGTDEETGYALYKKYKKDENGEMVFDKNVTSHAQGTYREIGKSAIPDFYGGISTSLNAYGVDFSIQTSFSLGGWIYDGPYQDFMGMSSRGQNYHKDMLNSWTPENKTDIPILALFNRDNNGSSDRFLVSASYFNIRNITLGYTFSKGQLSKYGIEGLRIYGVADNVFLFGKRKGLDPRQSISGSAGNIYSALRTLSLGISLNL